MKKISLVIGLGFGDEGKGATVNSLCNIDPAHTLVIRFNGGHQVGHTVRYKEIHHAFSNFGSGTLQNVPTYWSEYCTVNPAAVIKEGLALLEKGIVPKVIYNANAMITTPFDIMENIKLDVGKGQNHGTVGVGFGATIQRNEDHYHLYVRDLMYPAIRDAKLQKILRYYNLNTPLNAVSQGHYDTFIDSCDKFIERYKIVDNFKQVESFDKHLIFEGAQGIMLDKQYGFFPHVTRSFTTSRNAMEFIANNDLSEKHVDTYYITRAYQTRHGNGPMTNEGMDTKYIKKNPEETNVDSGYQGYFRKAPLDLNMLKYAMSCDNFHNAESQKKLVITCLDQVNEDEIPVTENGVLKTMNYSEIGRYLKNFNIIPVHSDKGFLLY